MKNLAIGVFDSGVGGLTVLKEVRALLPQEQIIYLGDTARVPYGNRSPYTVTKYTLENALFLLTRGIKMLVIACNTASALSLNVIKKKLPIPVIGVIEAGAREAVAHTEKGRIGIIGTNATVRSKAYEKAVYRINPSIEVMSRSCPLFVPIVEEGLERDRVAQVMARKYLGDLKKVDLDVLVMGCTHYPMLEPVIAKVMGKGIRIVNTGRETAKEARELLERRALLRSRARASTEYFVTDAPEAFREVGSRFLGEPIQRVRILRSFDYRDSLFAG
jgi:glutamate racemase